MSTTLVGLALIALVVSWATWSGRNDRRRAKARAMRRHPSARATMTERERRYHSDNSVGR